MDDNTEKFEELEKLSAAEQELLDKIRESADKVEVPEELSWERMEERLMKEEKTRKEWHLEREQRHREEPEISPKMETGRAGRRKKNPRSFKWLAAAAAVMLVLAGAWQADRMGLLKPDKGAETGTEKSGKAETEIGNEIAKAETEIAKADTENMQKKEEKNRSAEQGAAGAEQEQEQQKAADENTSLAETPPAEVEGIAPAGDYEEVYAALKEYHDTMKDEKSYRAATGMGGMVMEDAKDAGGAYEESGNAAGSGSLTDDFSTTNVQEEGVDEGDIVKTDGTYIYFLDGNGKVRIVSANGGSMEETGSIQVPDLDEQVREMYLDGEKLMLVTSGSEIDMEEVGSDVYTANENPFVKLYTYDIADRADPKLSGCIIQDGYYETSRKNGDFVYLLTRYVPRLADSEEGSSYIPRVGGSNVEADKFYLPDGFDNLDYLLISGVDVSRPDKVTDTKAMVSGANSYYVSTENLYLCMSSWSGDSNRTRIIRFAYRDGMITPAASGSVRGYLNNSFSLNEYDGYLRVVTTSWNNTPENALYVLDSSMKVCGKIEDLAKGETIQSARFMGDIGYFVTYKQMDPLFSVDLKDPKDPKILGELKITGFSSYLHFYGENTLLGIGTETDPETGEWKGIKLSMFDTSDPTDVREQNKYVMESFYDCPGTYNYKAIMIDGEKNLFGLACVGKKSAYMVFSYDPAKGFIQEFAYFFNSDGEEEYDSYSRAYDSRGLYIGSTFYLLYGDTVRAYDMDAGFEQTGKLTLE